MYGCKILVIVLCFKITDKVILVVRTRMVATRCIFSVKHTNAIAHATRRLARRRVGFSNTLFDYCQNIPARRRTRARVASVAAPAVAPWCVDSHTIFVVCRRVPRRVLAFALLCFVLKVDVKSY